MRFWDSQSGQLKEFVPNDPKRVTMYVCGPTVYNTPHIGNLRPAVAFDQLYRLLRYKYGEDHVVYTSNYTDIDDKIIARSNAEGLPIDKITEKAIAEYSWARYILNVLNPTVRPRATEYVTKMIQMIQQLVDRGFAYVGESGDILFRVAANPYPGMEDSRDQGETRLEDTGKEDPRDFVLWKQRKPGEPFWDSPWGPGRPGWHIECSAMIADTLGETIDIHGGGSDLKFPHHNAEMAQSACAHDKPLANYWLHSGMIQVNSVKMAKSLGNVMTVGELCTITPNEVLRLWMLGTHYRSTLTLELYINFRDQRKVLDTWYRFLYQFRDEILDDARPDARVIAALEDDLNTPKAIAELHTLFNIAKAATATGDRVWLRTFISTARFLGILYYDPSDWFHRGVNSDEIEKLISERNSAKAEKDWDRADELRRKITDLGVLIEDKGTETFWYTQQGAVLRS